MKKNTKQVYTTLAIVVVAAAVIWLFKTKPAAQPSPTPADNGQQNSQNPNPSPAPNPSSSTGVWTGTLKTSDTPAKGNLMLVTSERNIYLRTSRDFSPLLGKKVDVNYQGNLNSFVLGSITASATQ